MPYRLPIMDNFNQRRFLEMAIYEVSHDVIDPDAIEIAVEETVLPDIWR